MLTCKVVDDHNNQVLSSLDHANCQMFTITVQDMLIEQRRRVPNLYQASPQRLP